MNTSLTNDDLEDFYIRLIFDIKQGFLNASIKKAYRDFNRTIKNIPKEINDRNLWRQELINVLTEQIEILLNTEFSNQENFTNWHKQSCELICKKSNGILLLGQAQKWINMTLKYAYLFGEKRINGIDKNYSFFHIPIDNIIQHMLEEKHKLEKITEFKWSQITDYETYYNYQKEVRKIFNGKIIMDEEFKLFNKS